MLAIESPVSIIASGNHALVATTATQVTDKTGEGYLTIVNVDPTATVYIGKDATVNDTTGLALLPGMPRTVKYGDTSAVYVYSTGTPKVSWMVER